jgi:hypothetical protein
MATGADNLAYLEDCEPMLRALIEAASETAAIVRADGTFVAVNSSVAALAPLNGVGDLSKHNLIDFIAPEDEAVAEQVRELLRNNQAGQFECLTAGRSGQRRRRFEFRLAPLTTRPDRERLFALFSCNSQPQGTVEQQRAVADFGHHALRATELVPLLDEAVRCVAEILGVEYCAVMELQPDGKTLALRASVGWKSDVDPPLLVGTESHAGYALLSNGPVIVGDYTSETRFRPFTATFEAGLQSGLAVVIEGRKRPYGALSATTVRQRKFTGHDANFIQSVANIISQVVDRLTAEQALRRSEEY